MKMKKLTALALAGVLCLGMSTTAFAAASPLPKDAMKATDKYGNKVNLNNTPINVDYGEGTGANFTQWVDTENPKEASDNIKEDLNDRLKQLGEWMKDAQDPDKDFGKLADGETDQNLINRLKKETDALNKLDLTEKAFFEVAMLGDLSVDGTMPKDGVDAKFYLNNRLTQLDDIQPNQKIYLMHRLNGYWVVNEVTVESEGEGSDTKYYVRGHFDSFSPVAIIRVTSDGTPEVLPPDDSTQKPTPDTNGNGTVNQPGNATTNQPGNGTTTGRYTRTVVPGKFSPKTGE